MNVLIYFAGERTQPAQALASHAGLLLGTCKGRGSAT